VLAGTGCQPASDEVTVTEKPPREFRGEIESGLVGTWKTKDAGSETTYVLAGDGRYTLSGTVSFQGKTMDNNSAGEWRVDGEEFLIKDAQGNVVPYALKRDGPDRMDLTLTGSMKARSTWVRQ
jgi:hypothetical protein